MILLLALACNAPSSRPGETDPADLPGETGETGTPTDSGQNTGDTGSTEVLEGFEICEDGRDNDGDGAIDETDCASTWMSDEAGWSLGGDLVVASGDPSVALVTHETDQAEEICRLSVPTTTPELAWCIEGRRAAATVVEDQVQAVISRRESSEGEPWRVVVGSIDHDGFEESGTITSSTEIHLGLGGAAVDSAGTILLTTGNNTAYLLSQPSGDVADIESAASLKLEGDASSGFGYSVSFLPDPGGDGVADLVIGMIGNSDLYPRSGIFVFDGLSRGSTAAGDADGSVLDEEDPADATEVRCAGDVDGDGYEDLIVSFWSEFEIWPGPFQGAAGRADVAMGGASSIAGNLSFWGDEATELAFGAENYGIRVMVGPHDRSDTFGGVDDADLTFTTPYFNALQFGDLDEDGQVELITANPNYGVPDAEGHTHGMVATYDLSAL